MLAAKEVGIDKYGCVVLKLRKNCDVGKKGTLVKAPRDLMIFEYLKNLGSWAQEESDFLAEELNRFSRASVESTVVLDLGANVGLTSMQISRKHKLNTHYVLVEPLKMHIEALKFNLSNTSEISSFEVCEFALAETSGNAVMRIDELNRGSSQILKDYGQNELNIENVFCLGVSEFADKYLINHQNIFLKSDLEGHDVEVLGNLQPRYWENIRAGVVEVIPGEYQEHEAFWKLLRVLETFSCLTWDINNRTKLSSEEISKFWLEGDQSLVRNLFFSSLK
jgi:FkbM family methyltransferase